MRTLTLAAVLAALSLPAAAQQPPRCAPREMALDGLASKYHEAPAMHAVTSQGGILEVLLSDDGATWTLLFTLPNGLSCMAAEGQGWAMRPFARAPAALGNPS